MGYEHYLKVDKEVRERVLGKLAGARTKEARASLARDLEGLLEKARWQVSSICQVLAEIRYLAGTMARSGDKTTEEWGSKILAHTGAPPAKSNVVTWVEDTERCIYNARVGVAVLTVRRHRDWPGRWVWQCETAGVGVYSPDLLNALELKDAQLEALGLLRKHITSLDVALSKLGV